jgi:hypothetical protein
MSDSNKSFTIADSAARTADFFYEGSNHMWRGILFVVDATVEVSTAIFTPNIQVKMEDGTWHTIWTAAATISAVSESSYLLYPGAVNADFDGTEAVSIVLPQEWRLFMDESGGGDALTFSIRGHYIL